jgi:N6-L-threonylcarbamoyladenine synthase
MVILGIETSCDETAIAVVECSGSAEEPLFNLLGSAVHSQIEVHALYGGVYPMLAKREHIKNLPIVLEQALKKSGKTMEEIDRIAVTVGPGLEPALWTGITFAQDLANKYSKPLLPVNHMEGHIASVMLSKGNTKSEIPNSKLEFPAVALLISGGHTELVYLENWKEKKIIGQTKDDAVGEAFDKVARMLGLPYPGGPEISRLASQARVVSSKNYEVRFPRPMINSGDCDFSFSGLKTAVLYYIKKQSELSEEHKAEIAREFEDAVVEVLVSKSKKAIDEYAPKLFILGGGVAANKVIRQRLIELGGEMAVPVVMPEKELATDNAVMIAMAGYLSIISGSRDHGLPKLEAKGNLKVG